MVALALAALAALSYGAADFSGALAAKKFSALLVTVVIQVVSLLCLGVGLALFPPARLDTADLVWGALAGIGAAVALVLFYRALALGPMSVAAALTSLWSTGLPVIAGLALGDRPRALTLFGVALAVPSAVLVSLDGLSSGDGELLGPRDRVREWKRRARTRAMAIGAGIGFAVFFIALSRTSGETGLFPLLGARIASIAGLVLVASHSRQWSPIPSRWWPTLVIAGVLDFAANALYLLAVQRGSLAWVAAITSLYPVSTVLLARIVLRERLARIQVYGMTSAAFALILVGVGANG